MSGLKRNTTFLAILLKLLLHSTLIKASITIYDRYNITITNFDSLTAGFGPSIDDDGLTGYVTVAIPSGGCTEMNKPPNVTYVPNNQWIALIMRTPSTYGNCSFDLKVLNAQKAGFSAVIIYNSESDNLIKMSSSGHFPISIPSVFIGHTNGLELLRHYTYEHNRTYVVLNNDDDPDLSYLLIPFVCVVSVCFLVAMCIFVVKLGLHCRKIRKNRVPKSALKKIPTKKYAKTDKYDTCPICLNEYEEGVKIRILPCEHAYHIDCIDKWLLRSNRFCPVCKRRVLPGGEESDSENEQSAQTTNSAMQQQQQTIHEHQQHHQHANEDEDTNETSRLLVGASRNANIDGDSASLLTSSTNTAGGNLTSNSAALIFMNNDLTSLNNQMTMSITSSSINQLATSRTNNEIIASTNNISSNNANIASSSKYGSINSINMIPTASAHENKAFQSDHLNQAFEGLTYQSDSELISISTATSQNKLIKDSNRDQANNSSNSPELIDSKQTPGYYTPKSQTSDSQFVESYEAAETVDKQIKLKYVHKRKGSKINKIKPEQTRQKSGGKSQPINNENMKRIAAKLAEDEGRRKESLVADLEDADDETAVVTDENFHSVRATNRADEEDKSQQQKP